MADQNIQQEQQKIDVYFKIMIKRGKLIAIVVLAGVLTSFLLTFFSPVRYQAKVLIMVTPAETKMIFHSENADGSYEENKQTPGQLINISMQTHKMLLKSDALLKRLADSLGLRDSKIKSRSLFDIAKQLTVIESKETNILSLQAIDSSAQGAQDLANTWAQDYIIYNQEIISGDIQGLEDFVTEQFEIAKENLTHSEKTLRDFKDISKLDLLGVELNTKKDRYNLDKDKVLDLKFELERQNAMLEEMQKEFAKQNPYIVESKAITDDVLWQNILKGAEADNSFDKMKLVSKLVNPVYQKLAMDIIAEEIAVSSSKQSVEYITEELDVLSKQIDDLTESIGAKQAQLMKLTREVNIYEKMYDNLSSKIEEARIVKAMQLGDVKIVSSALSAESLDHLRMEQKMIISAFFSLILGAFLALFLEYLGRIKE